MQIAETDYNELLARIKQVERQSRLWKVVGLLALLSLGLSHAANLRAGQKDQDAPLRAKTVEAQTFLLKSAAGTLMGRMTASEGQPVLELYDRSGEVKWSTETRAKALTAR
jgi:hypothetical protein